MKIIVYYIILLIFIAVLSGFLVTGSPNTMNMPQILSVSALLALYVITMSFVGEGNPTDERELHHRYLANRAGLVAGTIALSIGILYQLFTHHLDYWLLAGLIIINLSKIISLIYLNYKR